VKSWFQAFAFKRVNLYRYGVALILCLNIGVDPPDVLKISPCARMQCWINPLSMVGALYSC
jgi:hypothetical protein